MLNVNLTSEMPLDRVSFNNVGLNLYLQFSPPPDLSAVSMMFAIELLFLCINKLLKTHNNASDYRTNRHYRTPNPNPNPNPSPLAR